MRTSLAGLMASTRWAIPPEVAHRACAQLTCAAAPLVRARSWRSKIYYRAECLESSIHFYRMQAVEVKEALRVQPDSVTKASVTYQCFFRYYERLAGMTVCPSSDECPQF